MKLHLIPAADNVHEVSTIYVIFTHMSLIGLIEHT